MRMMGPLSYRSPAACLLLFIAVLSQSSPLTAAERECTKARERFQQAKTLQREFGSKESRSAERAEELFLEAIDLCESMTEAHHNLAALYLQQGKLEAAEEKFRKSLDLRPDLNSRLGLATSLTRQNRIREAIEEYDAISDKDAGFLPAYQGKAVALAQSGKIEEALEVISAGLIVEPEHLQLLFNRAALFERKGLVEEAAQAYRDLLKAHPEHGISKARLGLLIQEAETANSELLLEEALAVEPDLIDAWRGLAQISEARGDFEEAEFRLRKAVKLRTSTPRDSINLARILMKKEQPALALELLEGLKQPLDTRLRLELLLTSGAAYRQLGKLEEAKNRLRGAVELDPASISARRQLREVYRSLGETKLAETERIRIEALESRAEKN